VQPFCFYLVSIKIKNMNKRKVKFKNPVCVLYWHDAIYTYTKKLPTSPPPLQVTAGFIVVANDKYVNIATNVRYDRTTGKLWPVDGFVIPDKAIIKFCKIGWLNEKK